MLWSTIHTYASFLRFTIRHANDGSEFFFCFYTSFFLPGVERDRIDELLLAPGPGGGGGGARDAEGLGAAVVGSAVGGGRVWRHFEEGGPCGGAGVGSRLRRRRRWREDGRRAIWSARTFRKQGQKLFGEGWKKWTNDWLRGVVEIQRPKKKDDMIRASFFVGVLFTPRGKKMGVCWWGTRTWLRCSGRVRR